MRPARNIKMYLTFMPSEGTIGPKDFARKLYPGKEARAYVMGHVIVTLRKLVRLGMIEEGIGPRGSVIFELSDIGRQYLKDNYAKT